MRPTLEQLTRGAIGIACVCAMGCDSSHPITLSDGGLPDAYVYTCAVVGTTVRWYQFGYGFESPACCSDRECDAGFVCSPNGRCTQDSRRCGCAWSNDCPFGDECVTNEVVCGACVMPGPACDVSGACPMPTDVCRGGFCVGTTAACWQLALERP